jgi:phage terminase Nu1 subunit (DNA packaging protein)
MISTDEVDASELAVLLGITPTAVRDAARRGVIERTGRAFALRASVQRYCAHLRKLVVERGEGPAAVARARLLSEQAEHAALKNARLRGALLDAEAVQNGWSAILVTVRGRMLAVPSRIQQVAPHLTASDVAVIDAEVRAALTGLADQE